MADDKLRDPTKYRVMPRPYEVMGGKPNYAMVNVGGELFIDTDHPRASLFYIVFPANDTDLRRLLKGDKLADWKRERVPAGKTTTRVPAKSAAAMVKRGWIVKADGPDDPYSTKAKEKREAARTKERAG